MTFQTCENCPAYGDDGTCAYTGERAPLFVVRPGSCNRFWNPKRKNESVTESNGKRGENVGN